MRFENELRREHVLPYIYGGAGVAIGDYDNDGLPDVYLVSQDGSNKLFRQHSPMRFEDVTESAGGLGGGEAWGSAASFADVDGDGYLDLYVCNTEAPNLLYQNLGDGTFRECAGPWGLAFVGASTGASFADYDNDGDLDLYLLTNRVFGPKLPREIVEEVELPADTQKTIDELIGPGYPQFTYQDGQRIVPESHRDFYAVLGDQLFPAGQRDRLFRNDGYGLWREVSESAGISGHDNGLSATWWDYDNDGWLDLYVANDLQSPDHLYHNQRDGTFADVTKETLPHTAFFGMGSDYGDLNNDGLFDLCVADMSSTTHYMAKMLMGSMSSHRWFLENAEPRQYMRNALYLNSGTERFMEAAYLTGLASSDWTWAVRFADLDGDGWLDFFATNGIASFEDNPDKADEFRKLWRSGQKQQALDIVRNLQPVKERNVARRNDGNLHFDDVGKAWGLDEQNVGQGAAIADLDRDGDLDIVVNNQNAQAGLFENRSTQNHQLLVQLRSANGNRFGVGSRVTARTGQLRQTRLVSLARGYLSAGEPVVHFGFGDTTTVDELTVRWPSGEEQSFRDLQTGRIYTIHSQQSEGAPPTSAPTAPQATWFEQSQTPQYRHQEQPFDDYATQPLLPHKLSQLGPGMACGDINGDGQDDYWIGGAAGQPGQLLVRQESGYRQQSGPWSDDAPAEDLGAVFFDYDSDGDLDLFVVSGSLENKDQPELLADRLYINRGAEGFVRAPPDVVGSTPVSGSCVCAADFDRDGDLDLFVGGRTEPGRFPEAPPSALLRNDDGRLLDVTASVAPALLEAGMVTGATWADHDGDGWPDLVVAAQWQPVRILTNDDGEQLRDATQELGVASVRGLWNSVAAADLDADGDLDFVLGNLGLNSKYHADPEHPLELYARDFDADGQLDVVEAKYEAGRLLPVRGRSCSSAAMPFLAERLPTYDAFARATLPEIYGTEELAQCQLLQANELRHILLENRSGSFVAHPLPQLAQISPVYGIGIADFNADGHLDLALAQNSFSPEPETGRLDGGLGLILAGTSQLEFEPLQAWRSGVVIPEDAMALCVTDLDANGAPDFVCTLNDGPLRSFLTKGPGQLAVRLVGPPGNPTAVGARLQLTSQDSAPQVREVTAGSGYLSQSSAISFFAPVAAEAELSVRWPDGSTTSHRVSEPTGLLVLQR